MQTKNPTKKEALINVSFIVIYGIFLSVIGGASFGYSLKLFSAAETNIAVYAGYTWGLTMAICGSFVIFSLLVGFKVANTNFWKVVAWIVPALLFLIVLFPTVYTSQAIIYFLMVKVPYFYQISAAFLPVGFYLMASLLPLIETVRIVSRKMLIRKAERIALGIEQARSINELDSLVSDCVFLKKLPLANKLSIVMVDYAERKYQPNHIT